MTVARFRIPRTLGCAALLALLAQAPGLSAQSRQEALAADFERMRRNVLQQVEAMPADGLGSAPTDEVRTFAEQIEHVCVGNVGIVASSLGVAQSERPDLGDNAVYLQDKDALEDHVNRSFDWVVEAVRGLSDAELAETTMLFGQAEVTKEAAVRAAYEHGVWTLGATVPYLRLNGATPPAYQLAPTGSGM